MLSKELEVTLNAAFKNARDKRHEFITVEHLLLALLDNAAAEAIMVACACNIKMLRGQLTQFIDETISYIPEGVQRETQPTLGFQRVLQRAVFHVQASDKKEVTGASIFVALFSEQDSHAVYLLHKQDVSRLDVVNFLAHGTTKLEQDNDAEEPSTETGTADAENTSSALEKYTTNLNEEFLFFMETGISNSPTSLIGFSKTINSSEISA